MKDGWEKPEHHIGARKHRSREAFPVVLEMSFWPVERLEKYRGRLSEIR